MERVEKLLARVNTNNMGLLALIFGSASWSVLRAEKSGMGGWWKTYKVFLWLVLIVCAIIVFSALATYGIHGPICSSQDC